MAKFRHVCIIVEDIDRALKFYVDLLGFIIVKQETLEGEYPSVLFGIRGAKITYIKLKVNGDDTKIELIYFHNPKYVKHISINHFAITVDNIEEEYKKLSQAGVEFLSSPQIAPDNPCKVCFCCDPDFNMIELVEDLK